MRVLVRLTVFAMLAAHLGACGERDVDPSGPYESDLDALRSAYSRAVASSVTATSGVQRIRRELRAAELASWLSLRQPREPWWVRARGHLLTAFQETDPLACEAGVALASHEASRPDYLRDALVTAETVLERFEGRGSAECLEGARRVVGILSPSVEREATKGSPGEARVADFRAWTTSPAKQESGARLVDVHVYGHDEDTSGQTARIVLRLDGVVPFEHGETPSTPVARRTLKVSLPGATLGQAFAPVKVAQGGAGTLRTTGGAAGVEVSIDLDDDTAYQLFFLADPYRLVLDLEKPDGGEVASRLRILVLDPGHGGDDYGARYGGLKEAKVALDITRRVGGILEKRMPDTRILQTRTRDDFVSLEQRVAYANSVGADAFVSIHLNAADEVVDKGVATFVLDTTNDRQALRLAARENGTKSGDVGQLQQILAGIHRKDQLDRSTVLAELVQQTTLSAARTHLPRIPDRGVKSAMFYVLVGARMPAILVEASFITQPDENAQLARPAYRQSLAEGIAEGVLRYARAIQ